MKLLEKSCYYNRGIKLAQSITGDYEKPVTFHSFWTGNLNEKHFYSVLSCYYFNVHSNNNNKIIVWIENNVENEYNEKISQYAEIRQFNFEEEKNKVKFLNNKSINYPKKLPFYSDCIRHLLLYTYGGCWFDLDCFFLRSFSPIFKNYESEICVYQWEKQRHPNGAIYISLEPESEKMKHIIEFVIERNHGWDFRTANLTYNLPLDILVLPCSWFDAEWLPSPFSIGGFDNFFKNSEKQYNFDNFYKDSFCYHWHNRWNVEIEENSIIKQLVNIILTNLPKNIC